MTGINSHPDILTDHLGASASWSRILMALWSRPTRRG